MKHERIKEKLRMCPGPLFQKMGRMVVTRKGDGGRDVFIKGYQVQLDMRNNLRYIVQDGDYS